MMASKKESIVWTFFEINNSDKSKAKCIMCGSVYSRGKTAKSYSTTSLLEHLKKKHSSLLNAELDKRAEEDVTKNVEGECSGIAILIGNQEKNKQKQLKIHEMKVTQSKYSATNEHQIQLKYELMEWIADAGLPYSMVENERFRHWAQSMDPRFRVPSEKYLRVTLMPEMYNRVKQRVHELIKQKMEFCSLTTDMWTSANMDAYMGVTMHFIDR